MRAPRSALPGPMQLLLLLFAAQQQVGAQARAGVRLEATSARDDTVVLASKQEAGAHVGDSIITTQSQTITVDASQVVASGDVFVDGAILATDQDCAPAPPPCNPVTGKLQFDGTNFLCSCVDAADGADCSG